MRSASRRAAEVVSGMKPVRLTQHAEQKIELLRQWGFTIDREQILEDMTHPLEVSPGYRGRSIARFFLDEDHVLRVVYEENGEVVIITMYPTRQDRYED
ncbi:MAG: DUF4258 domain-containing protein [SAR202 cluster bacterium]|nr:DUF4258 domain-containing protein [SAR202 cluster bacterium]MQG33127.1 DUF4258 domain-containing protein [SAR202 cluster bacterium]HCP23030.1 DUF4258 domain-containing protein [Dehalococcoidia bacterium]